MACMKKEDLNRFLTATFEAEGFRREQSREIADVLLTADLFGIASHGAQRLMYYHRNIARGNVLVNAEPEILRETPVSALIDGHSAMGQCVSVAAMNLAICKAEKHGIGMVSVRESSHFGIAGYYTRMAVEKGMAAFAMTNTGRIMVPTFGRETLLGTNPIAFAMPADPYPFWFDASTTVVSLGKVEVCKKLEKPMPEGWFIRSDGRMERNALAANQAVLAGNGGGLLPLGGAGEETGGHKGYGLALMVEALTGVLSGGFIAPEMSGPHGNHTCHFFLAFRPDLFGNPMEIRERLSDYLRQLRESETIAENGRIYTPGEKAWSNMKEREANGIPIDDATFEEMCTIAEELEIPLPVSAG